MDLSSPEPEYGSSGPVTYMRVKLTFCLTMAADTAAVFRDKKSRGPIPADQCAIASVLFRKIMPF